jgi:hypothetical protein
MLYCAQPRQACRGWAHDLALMIFMNLARGIRVHTDPQQG